MLNVKLIGTGKYLPEQIVDNEFLSTLVDTNDEWITSRSGISQRRITTGEKTYEMAAKAGAQALADAGIEASELDLIILTTITPDYFTPSTACLVQQALGAKNAICFDMNAACTGFIYAMEAAKCYLSTGRYKTALVVSAELLSKIVDWTDRRTCVLFGDGAGAVVLRADEHEKGIGAIYTRTESEGWECLQAEAVPSKNPFFSEERESYGHIAMEGKEVFKFATAVMHECIDKVLQEEGLTSADLKYVVPHQANIRIIDFVAKRMKLPMTKFFVNLDRYGNTSSASIPIALRELAESGELKKGDKLVLVGFGAGLTYGALLLEWSKE